MSWEKVESADIERICELENASFVDPWTENMFQDVLNEEAYRFFKLTEDGIIVGYMCYFVIVGEEAHITSVCVDSAYRRHGIGKKMFEHMRWECRNEGITSMTLEVRVSNSAAINLYEKAGFVSFGIRPKYYLDGEDALIMWAKIS